MVFPRLCGLRGGFWGRKIILQLRYLLAVCRQCDIVGPPCRSRCPPRHQSRNKIPVDGLGFVTLEMTGQKAASAPAGESEGKGMKKALVGVMLMLAAGYAVCAQDEGTAPPVNAGASFSESSASQVVLFPASDAVSFALV